MESFNVLYIYTSSEEDKIDTFSNKNIYWP